MRLDVVPVAASLASVNDGVMERDAQLTSRLTDLERQVRTMRRVVVVCLALGAIGFMSASIGGRPVPDVIQAKKFEVMNDKGESIGRFACAPNGNCVLAIHPTGSRLPPFFASATDDEGGILWLGTKDGRPVIQVKSDADGNGLVSVHNPNDGKIIVSAGADVDGHGVLRVKSKNGKEHVSLVVGEGGGAVRVRNDTGRGGASLGAFENGGAVHLTNKAGKTVVSMSPYENGGAIRVTGERAEAGIWLSTVGNRGLVHVFNETGKEGVSLSTEESGGSVLVTNKTGEEVVTLQVDEYGNGRVGAWSRKGTGHTLQPGPK